MDITKKYQWSFDLSPKGKIEVLLDFAGWEAEKAVDHIADALAAEAKGHEELVDLQMAFAAFHEAQAMVYLDQALELL